jgi:serine/threonine protein kinase
VTIDRIADRYEVIRPLGRGAFAHTLLARDCRDEREVALKVLAARDATNWKTIELFDREAAVLRALRHSGVPAIYDSFRAPWNGQDAAWLAMEYIEGTTLAETIAESGSLEEGTVRRLFLEVVGILDYLHTRVPPVLHRDIKPANIIVRNDGTAALVDFGAVRHVLREPDEHGSTIVGTYGYMPYEQYMGQASPASDLYATAATFLHLITGRPPAEWMTEEGRVRVPEQASCGEPLRSILVRLLSPSPNERYRSARQVIEAMLTGTGQAIAVSPSSVPPSVRTTLPVRPPEPLPPLVLDPAPRQLTGETAALHRKLAYSSYQLMSGNRDPEMRPGGADRAAIVFFSVMTAGILPIIMWAAARERRRRLVPFLTDGLPAVARILDIGKDTIGFGVELAKVRYEFEADGKWFRDADTVLPAIATRWDPGDLLHVLYLPAREYQSVIISTS